MAISPFIPYGTTPTPRKRPQSSRFFWLAIAALIAVITIAINDDLLPSTRDPEVPIRWVPSAEKGENRRLQYWLNGEWKDVGTFLKP